MGLKELVTNGLLLRKLLHTSERQANALERIASAIEQIAGPPLTEASPEELTHTGISFSRDSEQVLIQDFVDTYTRTFNRPPTDDEITEHLVERLQ